MTLEQLHPLAGGAPLQRRGRSPVYLKARATREDGTVIEATLTDLSFDGCGIDCAAGLRAGERIALSVERRGAIFATVRWAAGRKAGLAFIHVPVREESRGDAPRQHPRVSIDGEVSLRRPGKLGFRVRLFDLSPAGCKAEFVERPELEEQVWIKFDSMEALEARICWLAGTKAGMKFARPIHAAVFQLVVDRLAASDGRGSTQAAGG